MKNYTPTIEYEHKFKSNCNLLMQLWPSYNMKIIDAQTIGILLVDFKLTVIDTDIVYGVFRPTDDEILLNNYHNCYISLKNQPPFDDYGTGVIRLLIYQIILIKMNFLIGTNIDINFLEGQHFLLSGIDATKLKFYGLL